MPAISGKTIIVHVLQVKYILPTDNVISKMPYYQMFGRKAKLHLNLDCIPDLE